jgi:hypothetical protein
MNCKEAIIGFVANKGRILRQALREFFCQGNVDATRAFRGE